MLADGDDRDVAIRDDCDPDDPAWAPSGGCTLRSGDVTNAEFGVESGPASGPLAPSVIGHQAWRNDPPYLKIEEGDTVKVNNRGGRVHTFTEVAEFGGGRVPPLNQGLLPRRSATLRPRRRSIWLPAPGRESAAWPWATTGSSAASIPGCGRSSR